MYQNNSKRTLFITQMLGLLFKFKRLIWNLTGTKHSSELGNIIADSYFFPQFSKFLNLKLQNNQQEALMVQLQIILNQFFILMCPVLFR